MEPTIFKFVRRYSMRQQIFLTVMAAASFPFLYAFYELPKQIVNGAIQADVADFPKSVIPDFIAEDALPLDHLPFLFVLCALFLILVVVNQGFKYYVNVYRGLTGERMLRRLRYELYSRVLRFPLPTFRKVSQGEIIPMITAEVEPLGGFIGEAFSLPAFQGGTLLVIVTFLFIQSPIMAAAAIALYPLQMYMIPKLQRRVNKLGKERVRLVRRLSERIGETVQGVQEVHTHDTSNLELATFTDRLGSILDVRYKIYRLKFVIKFLNNFIQQLGPFFFLFDRRLSGDHRGSRYRHLDRGHRGAEGPRLAVEGALELLPADGGFADQVRAGRYPVRAERDSRRQPSTRRPREGRTAVRQRRGGQRDADRRSRQRGHRRRLVQDRTRPPCCHRRLQR